MANPTILDTLIVQLATETAWGTPVATQTVKLMDVLDCTFKPIAERKRLRGRRGTMAPAHNVARNRFGVEGTLKGYASYEDVLYLLEGMCGIATPSGVGPYTRNYAAPAASPVALSGGARARFYTLFYGESGDVRRITSALLVKLVLEFNEGEEVKYEASFLGKSKDATGTLTALSDRAVNPIYGGDVALYIDAEGGTIGSTQISNLAYSAKLTLDAMRKGRRHLGNFYPSRIAETPWEGELDLGFEYDTTIVKAYVADLLDTTKNFSKQVRLKATNGTNILQLDFAGTAEEPGEELGDDDGVGTYDINLKGLNNTTLGNWFKAQVVNGVAAVA